jgi:carbon-monoxide dehydrogenase medium subunit
MKPAAFDYVRPSTVAEACGALGPDETRIIAGGQSLGPMLNLRLAQPKRLIDISRLPDLGGVESRDDSLLIGACVTHAAIEDGKAGDIGQDVLQRIAGGIAYRAVRTRGTIGGSLAHADPAADWVTSLTALGATVLTASAGGWRSIPMEQFILGAFTTALKPGEIVRAVEIPKLGPAARWGYYKICRKPGEFALAIGAVLRDPERGINRSVIGATGGKPIVVEHADEAAAAGALHVAALRRAGQVAA